MNLCGADDHSEMVYAELLRRGASADSKHTRALAELWGEQVSRVITRVFELTKDTGRQALHIDARPEAIFELAQLLLWLTGRVVEKRCGDRVLDQIDIGIEGAALSGPEAVQRIENTACIVTQRIWNRIHDQLERKYPLIAGIDRQPNRFRLPGSLPRGEVPRTQENHFVPRFSIKPWADNKGDVREVRFSRSAVRFQKRPFRRWGFEHFLYPQSLEEYFQRVESRAAGPYQKVLQLLPLTPEDRYFFISFLILQHIRTPSYMTTMAQALKRQIVSKGWHYPTTPEAMRRVYLTIFQEDRVFVAYYRRLDGLRWRLLVPSACKSFPRTDAPIVLGRNQIRPGWSAYYPMSPQRCLQIGPEPSCPTDVPFALTESLNDDDTIVLNRLLLQHARRSAVVRITDDPKDWLDLLERTARRADRDTYSTWGPLVSSSMSLRR